jgi:hypothetical protein
MRPRQTIYRLAKTTRDFQRCHALCREQGIDAGRLSWPTVMGLRHDELIGMLSRIPSDKAVIAGPLAVTGKHPLLTIIRLVEGFDVMLWHAGVRVYHFGVDLSLHKEWIRLLGKLGMDPYIIYEGAAWYRRELQEKPDEYMRGSERSGWVQ